MNLVSNAIKFTFQGHVKIIAHQIKVFEEKEEVEKEFVEIIVEDTGVGIE